jgi:hypothetical protein
VHIDHCCIATITQQALVSPGQQQQQDDSTNSQQLQLTPTSSVLRRTAATLDWGQNGSESKDSGDSTSYSNSNSANASRTATPRGSVTAALLSPQQASVVKLFASSSDESSDDDHVRSKQKQHGHRKVL